MKKLTFSTEPYVINDDRFSTITLKLIFPCESKKEELFSSSILTSLLMNYSNKYREEIEYKKELKKRMIVSINTNIFTFNKNRYYFFNLIIPDPKVVKSFNIDKALEFFYDTIYYPKIIDNSFVVKDFEREKEYIKDKLLEAKKRPVNKAYQTFLNIVDDNGILKDNDAIYNFDLLNKTTKKDVYKLYQNQIKNNIPLIILSGNIDDNINNSVKKYFDNGNKKITIKKDYYNFLNPFKETKIKEERSKDNESILNVAFKVNNMKEEDIKYLYLILDVISINKLMFNKLRLEKEIVYHVDTSINRKAGILLIESYINNKSKDIAIEGIKEVIEDLKNEKKLKEYLENTITSLKYDLIRSLDSKNKKINDFIDTKLEIGEPLEQVIDEYENVNIENIIKFVNRLSLDTIYFLRGEFNE